MFSNHAKTRKSERYGGVISEEEDKRIVTDILSGHAIFLIGDRQKANFAVLIDHKAVPVVFDKKKKVKVTVLPRKAMYSMMTKKIYQLKGECDV